MHSTQHCNDNKKTSVNQPKLTSLEIDIHGGAGNPDDASGARIEVYRYAQHPNTNEKTSVNQLKSTS